MTMINNDKLSNYRTIPASQYFASFRSSHADVFLGKGFLKICSKFTGEHPCRSVISIKLLIHTSAWVFSCKFAAYFQNTFSYEHLWVAASVLFLSSPSSETLTHVPTSCSIPVHCEPAEPEANNDMYWNITLDVSTEDEVDQSESYPDVNSDRRYHNSSQFENGFPWMYYSHAQHWLDVQDMRKMSVQCRPCKRCFFSSPLCQYGTPKTRV